MVKKSILIAISLVQTIVLLGQLTVKIVDLPNNMPQCHDVFIAGSFNNWQEGNDDYKLDRLPNGTREIIINTNPGTLEFKFTRGSWSTVEGNENGEVRPNRTYDYDGEVDTLEIEILSWEDLGNVNGSTAADNVRLLSDCYYMPQLEKNRRVWIYLPPDYFDSNKYYPVLYMHDGQNLFDAALSAFGDWDVDGTLNNLFNNGDYGAIIVGIDNGGADRIDEYSPWFNPSYGGGLGNLYTQFIVETLKPDIDSRFRTLPQREYTGIMGSSMGGLISMYAAIEYQDVFSKAGIFSPSFWFSSEAYSHVSNIGKQEQMRIFLMGGESEGGSMLEKLNEMYSTLIDAGFSEDELRLITHADGQHSEWYWKREFGGAYEWLFGETSVKTNEEEEEHALYLAPNPVDSLVRIMGINGKVPNAFVICGLDGRTLLGPIGLNSNQIDVSRYPSGIYIFKLLNGSEVLHTQQVNIVR